MIHLPVRELLSCAHRSSVCTPYTHCCLLLFSPFSSQHLGLLYTSHHFMKLNSLQHSRQYFTHSISAFMLLMDHASDSEGLPLTLCALQIYLLTGMTHHIIIIIIIIITIIKQRLKAQINRKNVTNAPFANSCRTKTSPSFHWLNTSTHSGQVIWRPYVVNQRSQLKRRDSPWHWQPV